LISVDLTEVIELPASGVHFFQTNQITTTPNYQTVTGLTALRTYIFGRDGIFAINLGAQGDTGFGDGEWQNIKCKQSRINNLDESVESKAFAAAA